MNNLAELKKILPSLQESFGEKYLIIIAPYDLIKCNDLKIFDYFAYKKTQPPDGLLKEISILDIYFIEYKNISKMKIGGALLFHRMSELDIKDL
jgi:hypothetical protein